ncbi:MAG: hypothetical protein KDD55_08370 [Bdellovibrionales bacterium]|nr:hypothetical protein [Bdellovibrionales bacterium]
MTQLAIDLTKAGYESIMQRVESFRTRLGSLAPSREIILLGLALVLLQILDGVLTSVGVLHFGITAEGNPLLSHLMHQMGTTYTLILTKGLSIVIILALCYLASRVEWLTIALKGVVVIYLTAAIIPWSVILLTKLVFV